MFTKDSDCNQNNQACHQPRLQAFQHITHEKSPTSRTSLNKTNSMIHDQSCKHRSACNSYAGFLCSLFTRTFWQAVGTHVDYSTVESSKHSRTFSWKFNAPWGRLLSKVYRVQLKFPTEISPHLQIRISFGFKAALINRKCSAQLMTTDFLLTRHIASWRKDRV